MLILLFTDTSEYSMVKSKTFSGDQEGDTKTGQKISSNSERSEKRRELTNDIQQGSRHFILGLQHFQIGFISALVIIISGISSSRFTLELSFSTS